MSVQADLSTFFFKLIILNCGFSIKVTCGISACRKNGVYLSELTTFQARKMAIFSILLIRKKLKRYNCESENEGLLVIITTIPFINEEFVV